MTDEPVRIEFSTNAQEAASAIESINAALLRIPESATAAGTGIDSFVSRSMSALGRLSAEISRVSTQLKSLGSTGTLGATPIAPTPVAPTPAPQQPQQLPATPVEVVRDVQRETAATLPPVVQPTSVPLTTDTSSLKEANTQIDAMKASASAPIATTVTADATGLKDAQTQVDSLKASAATPIQETVVADASSLKDAQGQVDALKATTATPLVETVTAEASGLKEVQTQTDATKSSLASVGQTPLTVPVDPAVANLKEVQAQAQATKASVAQVGQQPTQQYRVQEYNYQANSRGQTRPVNIGEPQIVGSQEEAQRLKQEAVARGNYASVKDITPSVEPVKAQTAALKELSETQAKVSQTPVTSPQTAALLQQDTAAIEQKNTALNESLSTQRQATQAQPAPTKAAGIDAYIAEKEQLAEVAQAKQQAATAPAPANTANIEAETAAYRNDTAAVKENITAKREVSSVAGGAGQVPPVKPPVAPVETPPPPKKPYVPPAITREAEMPVNPSNIVQDQGAAEWLGREQQAWRKATFTQPAPVSQPQPVAPPSEGLKDWEKGLAPLDQLSEKAQLVQNTFRATEGDLDATKQAMAGLKIGSDEFDDLARQAGIAGQQIQGVNKNLNDTREVTTRTFTNKEGLSRTTESYSEPTPTGKLVQTTEIQNQMREATLSAKQFDAELAKVNDSYTRMNMVSQRASAPGITAEERVGREKQFSQEFDKAAAGADKYNQSIRSMANAQYEASMKGQPLTEQLRLTQEQMVKVGQASEEYTRLQGRAATLQQRISGQPIEGSVADLKQKYAAAREEFVPGSEASTKRLSAAHTELARAMKQVDMATGEVSQKQGFLTSLFERQVARIAIGIAIWSTMRGVQQVIQEQIQAVREYELEVSRFAAITGQSVDSAKAKWDEYARIATQAGVKPMEAAPAIRIAEMTPLQTGETDQVRQQFVRTVTQLEEVTGVTSDKIGKGLSSALKQAGMGMGEVARMGDLVASTLQRIPAANLDNVISALQEAAPLAQLWGVSFEEAFNIIVEGAARVQESPEQISTAFQRLSKGLNEISQGGSDAWERQSRLLNEFGINVEDAGGKLRPIPELLGEIANKLPTLSAPRQQALLEAVAGGSLRPEQMRNLLGGLEAFNVDIGSSIEKLNGTLNRMTDTIDKSLGQTIKVLDARIAQVRERGGILENLFVSLLRGTVGEYGGKAGAEKTAEIAGLYSGDFKQPGADMKDKFLKSLYGMSPEDAQQATKEWNDKVTNATAQQMRDLGLGVLNPFTYHAATEAESSLRVSDEEVAKALAEGGKRIEGASAQRLSSERRVQQQLTQAKKLEVGATTTSPAASSLATRRTPTPPPNPFLAQAETTMLNSTTGKFTGESIFPGMGTVKSDFDAIKYSMTEIAQAKQMSVQLSYAELEAQRQILAAWGMAPDKIEEIITAQKKQLEMSLMMVKTQRGYMALTGLEAARFDPAMGMIDQRRQRAKQQESNFEFQRHKEISPDQFPQLASLTAMYDAMLTKMGSPEKAKNINLLLGEENVFKTMTGRLTALQMAMEDLTKVEKAQLSGTWNMPAGATALVPISSLDVQRWNKGAGGGGGMSPEALTALLEQMGLAAKLQEEGGTGGGSGWYDVVGAVNQSAMDIVNAIQTTAKGAYPKAMTQEEIIKADRAQMREQRDVAQAYRERMRQGGQGADRDFTPAPLSGQQVLRLVGVQPNSTPVSPTERALALPTSQRNFTPVPQNMTPIPAQLQNNQSRGFELIGGSITQALNNVVSASGTNAIGRMSQILENGLGGLRVGGGGLSAGGGRLASTTPTSAKETDIEDVRSRRTTENKSEALESNVRATTQVGQRVDNVAAGVRTAGSMLMIPLLQMLYQLMQMNTKLGGTGTSAASAQRMATTTAGGGNNVTDFGAKTRPQALAQTNPTVASYAPRPVQYQQESALTTALSKLADLPNARQNLQPIQKTPTLQATVNVSMLPVKATLTANLSVILDGRVVARAMMPYMYEMLTRAARGQSVTPRGVLR